MLIFFCVYFVMLVFCAYFYDYFVMFVFFRISKSDTDHTHMLNLAQN